MFRAAQGNEQGEYYKQAKIDENKKYQKAHGSYERAKAVAILVCSDKVKLAFSAYGVSRTRLTNDIVKNNMEQANKDLPIVFREGLDLRDLLRKELLGEPRVIVRAERA